MTIELDFGQPQISAEQQKWQDRADVMSASQQMDISVVRNSGSWQLWPSSKVDNGIYIARYNTSVSDIDGGSDNA